MSTTIIRVLTSVFSIKKKKHIFLVLQFRSVIEQVAHTVPHACKRIFLREKLYNLTIAIHQVLAEIPLWSHIRVSHQIFIQITSIISDHIHF